MTEPNPKRARLIQVQSWHDLSPHLRRIVFHSPELADYPFTRNGAHIKILLPRAGQSKPVLPDITPQGPRWPDKAAAPYKRSYTLSAFDRTECTMTIDFVLHNSNGPASHFARSVQAGQSIGVSAPAGSRDMPASCAHAVIAGDLSALPAISAMLAEMHPHSRGDVWLWLPEAADLPAPLPKPAAINVHLFSGNAPDTVAAIAAQIAALPQPPSDCRCWFGGEAQLVAALRPIARVQWRLPAAHCYAVPFWRRGEDEEQYHRQRHVFMDADDAP